MALCTNCVRHDCKLLSLRHHRLNELLVIDLAISIDVNLSYHLVNFFVRYAFPKAGHYMTKLCCRDEATVTAIEYFENLKEFFERIVVIYHTSHYRQKFGKTHMTTAITVKFFDYGQKFKFRWVLAQCSHCRA